MLRNNFTCRTTTRLHNITTSKIRTKTLRTLQKSAGTVIVLGSCGKSGLSHILLGSVAERVAKILKVPVVIVKQPADNGVI